MSSSEIRQGIKFTIEPLPPLEALGNAWKRLDAAGHHSFFVTWTWIGTWLRCLPSPPQMALLRATRDRETVGLSVVTLRRRIRGGLSVEQAWLNTTGDTAYDCITIEHNGFASAGVARGDLWSAFDDWIAAGVLPAGEFILDGVDPAKPLHNASHCIVERNEYGYRTPLANCTTLEGVMSSLSRNSRQQLRRSMRAYEHEAPVSIEIARDEQTALAFFAEMKKLHIRSWTRRGRQHAFANPFFETFHRFLIRRGTADANVQLMRVLVGDRPIGYLYNFLRLGIVSNYQTGFDDADRHLRPGYVCHALAIAHYAAAGMSRYDFLGGVNQLKRSFGPERYELSWCRVRKKKPFFHANLLARRQTLIENDAPGIR